MKSISFQVSKGERVALLGVNGTGKTSLCRCIADTFFGEKIARRVLKMIESSGADVFVSHAPEQVRLACNRVIVLNEGKIIFDGEIEAGLQYYWKLKSDAH